MIPRELVELRARLESAGMVIVQDPDHLTVRLPFFCSVRVYFIDNRLKFEPFFGMVPRVRATAIKLGATAVVAVAFTKFHTNVLVSLALLLVLTGMYDAIRWLITEQAVTRTMMLEALSERRREVSALGQGRSEFWDLGSASVDRSRSRSD